MDFAEVIIPLAGMSVPVLVVATVMYFNHQNRKIAHKERLAMIEKGLVPEDMKELMSFRPENPPARSLQNGVITALVGLALLLGLGTIGYGPWLIGGLVPLAVGVGQVIAYLATAKQGPGRPE